MTLALSFQIFQPANPVSIPTLSVKKYLDFIREQSCSAGCADSWKSVQEEASFRVLHHLLENIFSSTATSAALERVFSHSGLSMRPHRGGMEDRMLADLVLLLFEVTWVKLSNFGSTTVAQIVTAAHRNYCKLACRGQSLPVADPQTSDDICLFCKEQILRRIVEIGQPVRLCKCKKKLSALRPLARALPPGPR